jgi:hypothetical protein
MVIFVFISHMVHNPHDLQMPESPFHAIFLMEAQTGLTLISKHYTNYKYNEDLLSGMFKALESFISNLSYSNQFERIEEINFGDTRIVYERLGPVMAVGISRKLNSEIEHQVLSNIIQEFVAQYGSCLDSFKGNISPFQDFTQRLNVNRDFIELHASLFSS